MKTYWVYLLANHNRTLYCGVTNDLSRRSSEHKFGDGGGLTNRYGVNKLVWFESYNEITAAIRREKEIKGWVRRRKIALIESMNPEWEDLYGQL